MNVLFLTLYDIRSLEDRNLYCDLLREFMRGGHEVYCVSPTERRFGRPTRLEADDHLLKVRIGNIQKTGFLEKGFSTLRINGEFRRAVKKYFPGIRFDLVLYSTPPITLTGVIEYIRKRDRAATYLLLKDIFPQNAVDLGILRKTGWKGILYRYFRRKEKALYRMSDRIGCMSPANVEYVRSHNPEIPADSVEVCPNSIEVSDGSVNADTAAAVRRKYGLPADRKVFVYGGNLGKPQGIPFLIECLEAAGEDSGAFFLIVGDGTEYGRLERYVSGSGRKNVKLMHGLPKSEYDELIASCDVGMIFLDYRFTIPNFPSRLLGYMQAKLPVLAVTDPCTDVGKVIAEGEFGWWIPADNAKMFSRKINEIVKIELAPMGERAFSCLENYFNVRKTYEIIKRWLIEDRCQ